MKLRDHSLASHKGLPTWPPVWVRFDKASAATWTSDEYGILSQVKMFARNDHRISIRMKYQQTEYIAHLLFDDDTFCLRVFAVLKERIGSAVRDLGDIDFN